MRGLGGKASPVPCLGLGLSVSLCLWTVSLQVFLHRSWDRIGRVGGAEGLFLPSRWAVRLWNLVPSEGSRVQKYKVLRYIKNQLLPSPLSSLRRCFSDIYCGNLLDLLQLNRTGFWWLLYYWVSLGFLTLKVVHTHPPSICWSQFRLSRPSTVFPSGSHSSPEAGCPRVPASPISGAAVCPVLWPLLWSLGDLLVLESAQLFTCP